MIQYDLLTIFPRHVGAIQKGFTMGWFWKSKAPKQQAENVEVEEVAALSMEEILQEEINQLKQSVETAQHERDRIRAEADEAIANERQHSGQKISELQSSLAETEQKLKLLDEANVSMAEMIRQRDQTVAEIQTAGANELKERDAIIQQRDERLADLAAELASTSTNMSAQVADLTQKLAKAHDEASSKYAELERRLATNSAESAERIAKLEKQLADSEAKSASRAEQRSALLRNMAEIHRLSTTSAKSDVPSEPLKIISNGWSEQAAKPATTSDADSTSANQFYSRGPAWTEASESESA